MEKKGFNPCFAGRPSPTLLAAQEKSGMYDVSILVLLEDPRQLPEEYQGMSRQGGFNPCFAGRPSPTRSPESFTPATSQFQSLFCWKTLANKTMMITTWKPLMFQSLFCWKTLANLCQLPLRAAGGGVSILVLLEDPRQQNTL